MPRRAYAALAALPLRKPTIAGHIAAAALQGRWQDARHMAYTATRPPDFAEKIVSHRHRYLWLCNPKIASRSIMYALLDADPDAVLIRDKSVSAVLSALPEARGYTSFAFIRSPLARALSFLAELNDVADVARTPASEAAPHDAPAQRDFKSSKRTLPLVSRPCKRAHLLARYYGLAKATDVNAFCEWLGTPYAADASAERHLRSQHLLLRAADGRLPDFMGRLETIEDDWQRICARLGMEPPPLPMLNTAAGWTARPAEVAAARAEIAHRMTPRSATILRQRYAEDFALEEAILAKRRSA